MRLERKKPEIRICCGVRFLAEWIHFTLFWDIITHYKTESVHFLGLMNSATKVGGFGLQVSDSEFRVTLQFRCRA